MLPKSSTLLVSLRANRTPAAVRCLLFVFLLAPHLSVSAAEPVRPLKASAGADLPAAVFRRIGKPIPKRDDFVSVAFTPDGRRLVVGSWYDGVHVYDVQTGVRKMTLAIQRRPKSSPEVRRVLVSPLGAMIAAEANGVHVWDAATGKRLHDVLPLSDFHFSPDEKSLIGFKFSRGKPPLFKGKYQLVIYDARSFRLVRSLKFSESPFATSLSTDGRALLVANCFYATIGADQHQVGAIYSVRMEDLKKSRIIATIFLPGHIVHHPENDIFATDGPWPDNIILVKQNGHLIHKISVPGILHKEVTELAFSADGKWLAAVANRDLYFWEVATGQLIHRLEVDYASELTSVAFSPDSKLIATGARDGTVILWQSLKTLRRSINFFQDPSATAPDVSDPLDLWRRLASPDSLTAYRALAMLALSPDESVELLQKELRVPDIKKIRSWIADLDDDKFLVREIAQRRLRDQVWAVPGLLEAAKAASTSLEQRIRLSKLLPIPIPTNLKPILGYKWRLFKGSVKLHPEQLRMLRAIHLLELIRSRKARKFLASLVTKGDPALLITQKAIAALKRIDR